MRSQVSKPPAPADRLRLAISLIAERTRGRPLFGRRHDDADAVIGTIDTDDAIGFDPIPVLRALSDHGARAVVIGQVAGILHGSAELTGDLDLLWSGDPNDAAGMQAAFASLHATLKRAVGEPLEEPSTAFELPKVLFETRKAAGDCCTPRLPWGGLDVEAFLRRAETAEVEGALVRYLALDDLAAMRRIAGRPKDLRRADELMRVRANK